MHDRLFANQKALQTDDLLEYARALGLDESRFKQCLFAGAAATRIGSDLAEARKHAFASTPTFLIGVREPDGNINVMKKITGAQSLEVFQVALDDLLTADTR